MEGGPHEADKTEFTECWRTTWKTPYIMRLAFSAGIGGLLFGYDTVSMAVAGAIFGAGFGGWLNDKYGRRKSILLADILFFVGAIVMALALVPWVIIIGIVLVASPAGIRGALVSTNGLLITGGQFLSYLINLAFTRELGVAGIPALIQFFLMLSLPESPRWLYRAGKKDEAKAILEKIYPAHEVEDEMRALEALIETEKADADFLGGGIFLKVKSDFSNTVVRRGLYAGITVQVTQQFVGINTVMYYNSISSLRLMIFSMIGIIVCLIILSLLFMQASSHAPPISMGTAPWIVNSEIYPLRHRGFGGGIATVSNWVSNLIVSETFLTLTEAIGSAGTFLLFAGFSTIGA
ncbi:hypothetical protein K7X08_028702 [Anisodus acutangulus]|uniref:Major facilitator superfamily (MFS) profile domain-containing protein n=1 Tax=Anisodus acutangulus TaxID=402998 RepID=A0A9Q1L0P8_9SOLA|nr:hypothetical protein K7X08_028702 [Anisodus acutangulus]